MRILKESVNSTNSEQNWLHVNRSCNVDTQLLRKTAVCCDSTQDIDNKIIKGSMPLTEDLCSRNEIRKCSICAIFLSSSLINTPFIVC